jgi:SsrA-binding protein
MIRKEINIVNKKAKFEYEFIRTEIAGIVLMGSEVKSIRDGKISLVESYCSFNNGELYLKNANITEFLSDYTHKSSQDRKLLLKKVELNRLKKELIKGLIKVEIVLARGKNHQDKRDTIKKRDIEREIKLIM